MGATVCSDPAHCISKYCRKFAWVCVYFRACESLNSEVPAYGCMQLHVPPEPGPRCGKKVGSLWCWPGCIRISGSPSSYITGRSNHWSAYHIHLEMGDITNFSWTAEVWYDENMNGNCEGSTILEQLSWFLWVHYNFPAFVCRNKKPKRNSSQENGWTGWDSNREPPEYCSSALRSHQLAP